MVLHHCHCPHDQNMHSIEFCILQWLLSESCLKLLSVVWCGMQSHFRLPLCLPWVCQVSCSSDLLMTSPQRSIPVSGRRFGIFTTKSCSSAVLTCTQLHMPRTIRCTTMSSWSAGWWGMRNLTDAQLPVQQTERMMRFPFYANWAAWCDCMWILAHMWSFCTLPLFNSCINQDYVRRNIIWKIQSRQHNMCHRRIGTVRWRHQSSNFSISVLLWLELRLNRSLNIGIIFSLYCQHTLVMFYQLSASLSYSTFWSTHWNMLSLTKICQLCYGTMLTWPR